jgi:alkylation response protein AidB-like acyl-CoA dehydrogenase
MFVTNAPVADLFLVFATIDRSRGFGGVCAFLVERDDPGLAVGKPARKMGLDSSPMSDVVLQDCVVPAGRMLGAAGGGIGVFNAAMERERSFILASTLGTMQRDLDRCVSHARERRQFDQPIGRFQAVSHRIVDMRLRLDTARLLLYRLGWLMEQGRPIGLESALVKLHLSECFLQSSLDAVQIHGGYGYLTECELEQDVRDAVASRIYSGTSEVLRNLAARHMGL